MSGRALPNLQVPVQFHAGCSFQASLLQEYSPQPYFQGDFNRFQHSTSLYAETPFTVPVPEWHPVRILGLIGAGTLQHRYLRPSAQVTDSNHFTAESSSGNISGSFNRLIPLRCARLVPLLLILFNPSGRLSVKCILYDINHKRYSLA